MAATGIQAAGTRRVWPAGHVWAWTPLAIAAAGVGLSLPARLSFRLYFSADAGSNLAATLLARAGQRPNLDFGFPFGPLTLALQQAALAVIPSGAYAMAALTILGTLLFGWGASWGVRRLRMAWAPALLLWAATATVSVAGLWEPVYALESAALLWALLLFAAEKRGWALSLCVTAALVKPSMGVVLGALLLAEALGRRQWRSLLAPLVTGLVLTGGLTLIYGAQGLLRLALPLAGAKDYRLSHYSFFSTAGNPFAVPGASWGLYAGTPLGTWGMSALVLLAAVLWLRPAARGEATRWYAAVAALIGTLAFITAFYSWKGSYWYYCTLPLTGLALLAWPVRRRVQIALASLAALALLGTFTSMREAVRLWAQQRPAATTAELWAAPDEAQQWMRFARAHPPASQPLLLAGSGAPAVLFPAYGPPWHGFLYPGEATAHELNVASGRADSATCIVFSSGIALPPALMSAIHRHQPARHGALFDTYGCP